MKKIIALLPFLSLLSYAAAPASINSALDELRHAGQQRDALEAQVATLTAKLESWDNAGFLGMIWFGEDSAPVYAGNENLKKWSQRLEARLLGLQKWGSARQLEVLHGIWDDQMQLPKVFVSIIHEYLGHPEPKQLAAKVPEPKQLVPAKTELPKTGWFRSLVNAFVYKRPKK